jgi:hypothetical protein
LEIQKIRFECRFFLLLDGRRLAVKKFPIYKIIVILMPDFGERLTVLATGVPVWIVDTPINTPVAHRLWKERPGDNHLTGITTFRIDSKDSPEQNFLNNLSTIDLHHGPLSADSPYMQIQVLGTTLTDAVREALADYQFDEFKEIAEGFEATRRTVPTEES